MQMAFKKMMTRVSYMSSKSKTRMLQVLVLVVVAALLGVGIWQIVKHTKKAPKVQAQAQALSVPFTPSLPDMTDDQAKVYAANLPIYNSRTSTQSQRDAAVLALYPLIDLHLTGPQYSQGGQPGPDSILRKYVTADYAALQGGRHAA